MRYQHRNPEITLTIKGRGAAHNPPNRFEPIAFEPDGDFVDAEEQLPTQTVYYKDTARSIIATNDSPDVGFTHSINPYRGCSHGCIYCYARPTHEYFGLSAGLDFETKIFVKPDAAELLRHELMSPKWEPRLLSISGVTDCYQPVERKLRLTRQCLEVLAEFRNPAGLITKNHLITRDIDMFRKMNEYCGVITILSVTTLDPELSRLMEPQTSVPARRLAAIEAMARAGIPVGVMLAPIIPGLTDHEIPSILSAAAGAGARFAGYVPVRLPLAVAPLFENWLERHYPERKDKVLNRIRSLRGGKLNDSNFHTRMRGGGIFADQIENMFRVARRKAGLDEPSKALNTAAFRRPGGQMTLF